LVVAAVAAAVAAAAKPSYSLAFNKPENILPLNYIF
jgi:hypothetical protein